jgi:hypothetical protein
MGFVHLLIWQIFEFLVSLVENENLISEVDLKEISKILIEKECPKRSIPHFVIV